MVINSNTTLLRSFVVNNVTKGGVRLEDDVVIQTKGEPINLMEDIPIETDHIEELMN